MMFFMFWRVAPLRTVRAARLCSLDILLDNFLIHLNLIHNLCVNFV
jgi:hypothetical protein